MEATSIPSPNAPSLYLSSYPRGSVPGTGLQALPVPGISPRRTGPSAGLFSPLPPLGGRGVGALTVGKSPTNIPKRFLPTATAGIRSSQSRLDSGLLPTEASGGGSPADFVLRSNHGPRNRCLRFLD